MTIKNDMNKQARIKHPEGYNEFKRLHRKDDAELENKEFEFWTGFAVADKASGHFSQDEINFVKAQTSGSNDWDSWNVIIKEMEKSKRG